MGFKMVESLLSIDEEKPNMLSIDYFVAFWCLFRSVWGVVLTLTEAMRSNSLCASMKRGLSPQKT